MATVRAAAIQLDSVIGNVDENLSRCERLADDAGAAGAEWILLPEFFTTGMGFDPALHGTALPPESAATELLIRLAKTHSAKVGGSFLCRDDDGHVRNAFFLATPAGIVGRHDKDIPTLWENCWYVGGTDDGVIELDGTKVGVALCLEFGRTATVRRLRGVDLVIGGSFTWRFPSYWPNFLGRDKLSKHFFEDYSQWAVPFARLVGAPVVEATHCGTLDCKDLMVPALRYRCTIGNDAKIVAADGKILASRSHLDGPGFIIADVEIGSVPPTRTVPDRPYIIPFGTAGNMMWSTLTRQGIRYYQKHHRALKEIR